MENPYAGQDYYADAWDQGYAYGGENPGDTNPIPPDFSGLGVDEEMTQNLATIWLEGALAGRDEAGPALGYDSQTDTFVGSVDEYPGLTLIAQSADADEWLAAVGIDPAIFSDGIA